MHIRKKLFGLCIIALLFLCMLIKYKIPTRLEQKGGGIQKRTNDLSDDKKKTWTILMTVNDGYFDFIQNWLHYYNKLQLNYPLIVIAEDDIVFLRISQLNGNDGFTIVRSWSTSLSSSVEYGTKDFINLTSYKPDYILRYLENGSDILYADTDSVWLQDPFPFLNGSFDIRAQKDDIFICSGFLAIKSNQRSIELMRKWKAALKIRPDIDQTVLNEVYKKATIRLNLLDTNLFPSGQLYFDKFDDVKRKHVVIVHNNYIIGHDKKLERFKKFKLWFA